MSNTSDILFEYLREVFYATPKAAIDLDRLEDDYAMFAKGLMYFAQCFTEYNEFAKALSKGDLSVQPPPPENELAAPLKSLQASLKHLTWQSQQVAKGDYKQRVDFMGDFSEGFNMMVDQLSDRQMKLENEIFDSQRHTKALEQSYLLLRNLIDYIPQQIYVVALSNKEIMLQNDLAKAEAGKNPRVVKKLVESIPNCREANGSRYFEIQMEHNGEQRYLAVNSFYLKWEGADAVVLLVEDISEARKQLRELEDHAYRDALTHVYNRFFGMYTLNEWLAEKRQFALIFIDLDHLKYINDAFGHNEGDLYITKASYHLRSLSDTAVVSRLGGDEFMVLVPELDHDEAKRCMDDIGNAVKNDEHTRGKNFSYSISVGIVAVDAGNTLSASEILSLADERMYEQKKAGKRERQAVHQPDGEATG